MLRKLALIPIVLIVLTLLSANNVLAYSEKTTHPALTSEILNISGNFTAEERAWIIYGSQEEDYPPRWVNHFYDPVNNTGWTGDKAGDIPPEVLSSLVSIGAAQKPLSALDWVKGCNTQSVYQQNGGNRVWQKALDYYVEGNMKEAYITLGHILHIVEDMGVPDHTRDDTHAQNLGGDTGSPFEQYTAKYDTQTIKQLKISEGLSRDGLSAPKMNSLEDYLKAMAIYSNKYFFSKDTINDPKYPEPNILWDDGNFAYGKDERGIFFPLSIVSKSKSDAGVTLDDYSLKYKDAYFPIFDAYFTRLSRQIVLNGAGIVALFKKQASDNSENEKGGFYNDDRHAMAKIACQTGDTLSLFTPMGIVSGIGNVVSSVFGQIANTLKSGAGFVIGLVAPKTNSPTTIPQSAQENTENNDLALADESADITTDAPSYDDTTAPSNRSVTSPVAPPAPTTVAPLKPTASTSLVSITRLATSTATASTTHGTTSTSPLTTNQFISYGGGGGGNAQNQNPQSVPNNNEQKRTTTSTDVIATSTDEIATSTPKTATSTDAIATSTEEAATSTETTTTEFAAPAADHVLISEILFDADGADTGKEFVELYNPANSPKDLTGYKLKYISENSTTTHTLVLVHAATSTEQPIIPARGFLLFGFGDYDPQNYGGKTPDISRSASLPNGEDGGGNPQKIKLGLYNETNAEIDSFYYDQTSIPAPGHSLERLAWNGTVCVSPVNGNEFLGNGCVTGEKQFESRQTPRPQNSLSLPEPREKPTAPTGITGAGVLAYNIPANLAWQESSDALGSTSTILYKIYEISSSTPALTTTTASLAANLGLLRVGGTYNYGLVAEDRDGLSSATTTFSIEIPGFLDKIYFYQDPKDATRYLIDVRYSHYNPLIPGIVGTNWWEAMIFYLNHEPNPANNSLPSANNGISYPPNDSSGIVSFPIFSFDPDKSRGYGQGLYHSSFVLPAEDGRMILDSGLTSATSSDYITVAYYNHVMNGGIGDFGAGTLVAVATDARKIYLSDPPPELPPTAPQNLVINFDSASMRLNLSWASSTDPDSYDAKIKYEINFSTSTELSGSTWQSVGESLAGSIMVLFGNQYLVGVRAVDDTGAASEPATQSWSFPADFTPITPKMSDSSANGVFTFVPDKTSTIKQIVIADDSGTGVTCSSQSLVQINGHDYLLTSAEGGSPTKYIYQITSSTEPIYVGVPISIVWRGNFLTAVGVGSQAYVWTTFSQVSDYYMVHPNWGRCYPVIATSTATLVSAQ